MKGQFMMISAIIAGLITISAASTISSASNTEFKVESTSANLYLIKSEASEFDFSRESERRAFREFIESYAGYSARTEYWSSNDCLNVTINTESGSYSYTCLPGS